MAIAKASGQNVSNITYDHYIQTVPINSKVKKRIFIDGVWKEILFIQIDTSKQLETWLQEKYPNQGYLKDWWITSERVTMTDKIYVHWKMCE